MSQSKDEVICGIHGQRRLTFVCTHIAEGLLGGTTAGFVVAPEDGTDAYPLAWCDDCERRIGELSWQQWLGGASDFKMLCSDCYLEARDVAQAAGRYQNLSAT